VRHCDTECVPVHYALCSLLHGAMGVLPAHRAEVEEYGRVTAMRAAILGAMACLCERSPTNTLLLGSLSGTVSDIARVAEKASVGRCRLTPD